MQQINQCIEKTDITPNNDHLKDLSRNGVVFITWHTDVCVTGSFVCEGGEGLRSSHRASDGVSL